MAPSRRDWENAIKPESEGGNGTAQKVWDWSEEQTSNTCWGRMSRSTLIPVRGLVPKDGWEPLCAFLDEPVHDKPFPHTNAAAGWAGQQMKIAKRYILGVLKNMATFGAVAVYVWAAYRYYSVR